MELCRLLSTLSLLFIILEIFIGIWKVEGGKTNADMKNEDGNRALVFNKPKKKTTPKPVYKWSPKENTRLELAKQKGISENEIQDTDPEFEFLWPDNYYDDYDFEHKRNMIQHGTWEALRQNYHEAELREAKEALKKEKEATTNDP